LASSLQTGAVSYLFYADRLVQLPLALFGTAMATVLLPSLTDKLKQKQDISQPFLRIFSISFVFSAFCFSYIFINSELIINTLFERGEFTRADSVAVAETMALMAFAIPAIFSLKITSVMFYANADTKTPMLISLISFILNVALCLILMQYYSYFGLVMAGVVAAYFTFVSQIIILIKRKIINIINLLHCAWYYIIVQIVIFTLMYGFNMLELISLNDVLIIKLVWLFMTGVLGLVVVGIFIYLFKLYKS
jgi:putative peptidoglycan lipid II flippase